MYPFTDDMDGRMTEDDDGTDDGTRWDTMGHDAQRTDIDDRTGDGTGGRTEDDDGHDRRDGHDGTDVRYLFSKVSNI